MRLNMTQQGGLVDEFVSGGGSVLNPLILMGNPTSPLEAATKQYVDASLMSLNVNNVIGGTISGNRFPAMNGDLVSSSGSANLVLSNTGVTPGTYPKVSVDNKGRVTNGMSLIESEIPGFSWNKVISDTPTTLNGYGITDALSAGGGTMTGQLSISGTPTLSNQLVNKSYLDSVVGGTTGIAVGDIIAKIDTATPTGFLKCNGAELDKTSYTDLYNAVGDRYVTNGKSGNGQPWRNQYDINTEDFSGVSTWRAVTSLPGILGGSITFVTKNRVYVFGGNNGSSHVGTGYTALINNDGTLGAWAAATALPGILAYSTSIVTKNKVYLLGGYINNTTATNLTYVADINADGTIGTWGNGPNMPSVTSYSAAFVNNNRIYVVGGYNGSAGLTTVFSSNIKEDGSLDTWTTEAPLPIAIGLHSINVIKNRVYIFGGQHSGTYSANIYSAALNSDGSIGTWQLTGTTPVTLGYHCQQTLATRNFVYIFGGVQNGSHSANVYKAPILVDGSIGSWQLVPWTLPATLAYSHITVTKDHIYVLGGMIAGGWSAVCWTADMAGGLNDYSSFYSNVVEQNYMVAGSGKPWQQQYQSNTTQSDDITGWITDSSVLTEVLAYSSVIVTKNHIYLLGGHNGTISSTKIYSTSINADGTLGTWITDTNLPGILGFSQCVITSNRVYLLGGNNNSGYTSVVYTAPINSDGTLGTWVSATNLPVALDGTQAFVTRNRIYLVGGFNGTSVVSTVYTAVVNLDGTIGTWSLGVALPVTLAWSQAIITKNRVYLLGGKTGIGNTAVATVYTAPINADGTLGIWTSSSSLPGVVAQAQAIVTKNKVYLLGGWNNTTNSASVYMANINNDGILGTWSTGTSLPVGLSCSQLAVTNNRIYLLGGITPTGTTNSIYSAPILEGLNDYSNYYAEDPVNYTYPGSGRPWENQYQINTVQSGGITGWSTSATGVMSIYLHIAIVTKNRVYVGAGNSNVMYTALINSDGTLGTWTSLGAVLPVSPQYASTIVTKNRAFIIGSTGTNAILTAAINADGTLGTWSSLTGTPVTFGFGTTFVTKNKLYVIGGYGTTAIYYATINDDGTLGGWKQNTFNFPINTNLGRALVTKNRVYFIGGNQGGGGVTNVWTAQILPDGTVGNWVAGPSLLTGVEVPAMIATQNTVIIGGGWTSGTQTNVSQVATINADGTLGNWSYGTVFPMSFHSATPIVTNGKVHLIGGAIAAGTANSNIYTANFSGGLNDYSSYMNGDILPIEQFITTAKFKLPDASFTGDNLNYFIKY